MPRYTTPRTRELGERIEQFITKLGAIDRDKRIKTAKGYESAVKRISEAETRYWREKLRIETVRGEDGLALNVHGSVATLHGYFTDYRNAIKDHYEGHLNERNSYGREVGVGKYARIERQPIAIRFFAKTSIEARVESSRSRDAAWTVSAQVPTVSRSEVMEIANKLILSNSYIAVAIGLCAVTGRRPTEILKTAQFTKTGDFSVIFEGQLKAKTQDFARGAYEIPLLVSADLVIERLAFLRAKKDFSQMDNRQVEKLTAVQISDKVIASFDHLWRNPSAKDLRAIYSEIVYSDYRAAAIQSGESLDSKRRFVSELLGHNEGDESTAKSYDRFTVID